MSTIAIRGTKVRLESVETHNGEPSVVYGELDREWLSSEVAVRVNLHGFGSGKIMALRDWRVEIIPDPLEDGIYQMNSGVVYRVEGDKVELARWYPSLVMPSNIVNYLASGEARKIEVGQ